MAPRKNSKNKNPPGRKKTSAVKKPIKKKVNNGKNKPTKADVEDVVFLRPNTRNTANGDKTAAVLPSSSSAKTKHVKTESKNNTIGLPLLDQLSATITDLCKIRIGATSTDDDKEKINFKFVGGPFSDPNDNPRPNGGTDTEEKLTLEHVGGLEDHIKYLKRSIIIPMVHTEAAKKWGLEPPKGIMFHGPPGTGKTLLAKVIVNELSKELKQPVAFFYRKGGDLFDKYFGESSKKIRELFNEAKNRSPAVIFFDEIDGLCPSREKDHGTEAYNTVVTALLGVIDETRRGEIIIIGATNRLESVDQAIRRPGRFDKSLTFYPPDMSGRKSIIKIHARNWPHDHPQGAFLDYLAESTSGFTGADLEKLVRETFYCAFDRHCPEVDEITDHQLQSLHILPQDWENALTKVRKTDCNVFGSCIYAPEPPAPAMLPLIENTAKDISARLSSVVPTTSNVGISSFIICDNSQSSPVFIDQTIIPQVLVRDSKWDKVPKFILSLQGYLCTGSSNPVTYLTNVIHRAGTCGKFCILFIPRLDILWETLSSRGMTGVIGDELLKLRGKSVLILATASSCSITDSSPQLTSLFIGINRSFKVPNFTKKEREKFFRGVFDSLETHVIEHTGGLNKEWEKDIAAMLASCVNNTATDVVDLILALHSELVLACAPKFQSGEMDELRTELKSIIDNYVADKFR